MKQMKAGEAFGLVLAYMKFRDEFISKRAALFDIDDDDEEEDDEPEERSEEKDRLQKKWAWEKFLYNIAKRDYLKIEGVTELNLFFVFTMEAMRNELKIE